MNLTLQFEASCRRPFGQKAAPLREIGLKWNGSGQHCSGLLDSSSCHKVLNYTWSESFGMPIVLEGGGGNFRAWGPYPFDFELTVQDAQGIVVEDQFAGPLYFAETVPRNWVILGRMPIFDRYVIAFCHRQERMLFAHAI